MNEFEWINNHYGLDAYIGRDITVSGKKGTITEDKGNYIGVTFHDDKKFKSLPCHPTSEVIYLDTCTDVKTLRVKNWRSKQRYSDYLNSDSSLTFAEWIGVKSKCTYSY